MDHTAAYGLRQVTPPPATSARARWVEAAIEALASGGLEAIAVEPLAARLGMTKGSFYWHFRDRAALVDAVLEEFEAEGADGPIRMLSAETDPRARLLRLFRGAFDRPEHLRAERALLAASDERVASTLTRVHQKRRAFLERCYRDLGLSPKEARDWATTAYTSFVGAVLLSSDKPFVSPRALTRWLEHLTERLVPSRRETARRGASR